MEDRLIRESEHAERRDQSRKTIADLQQEIRGLMEVHTATTRDYLNLRQAEQVKEKVILLFIFIFMFLFIFVVIFIFSYLCIYLFTFLYILFLFFLLYIGPS